MNLLYQRTELLLGAENVERLKKATVMVVGLGGVGGMAAEALARTGIGKLVLVDHDQVDPTNVNRQVMALSSTIGQSKVVLMASRIRDINPQCEVIEYPFFWNEVTPSWLKEKVDYVVDAIDTLSAKAQLYNYCIQHMIPFISSGGMANRRDPLKLQVTTLNLVTHDPFAKQLRSACRQADVPLEAVRIVISKEPPYKQNEVVSTEGVTRKQRIPPSSIMMVPATAGLVCAAQAVEDLCQLEK